jgi:hypothetical protein
MGTWGFGAFENDQALDWIAGLDELDDPELLADYFVIDPDEVEADQGVEAIAASEVVAAFLGYPSKDLPAEASAFVARHPGFNAGQFAKDAVTALDLTLGETSQLQQLWSENEADYPAWRAAVTELRERIANG